MEKNPNIYYVYTHRHPDTGEVFYVGRGSGDRAWNCNRRLPDHKQMLQGLLQAGYLPTDYARIEQQCLSLQKSKDIELDLIFELAQTYTLFNRNFVFPCPQALCEFYQQGHSYVDIKKKFNIHDSGTIRYILKRMGISPRNQYSTYRWHLDINTAVELLEKHGCVQRVAAEMGCHVTTIYKRLRKAGKPTPKNKYDANLVVKMRDSGMTYPEISGQLGINPKYARELYVKHKKES